MGTPPDQRDRQDAYRQQHPPPPPSPPPAWEPSLFSGKGMFTTSEAGSTAGHACDWVAVQMDPEGGVGPTNSPARLCWWQARPTQAIVDFANEARIPYIGQAENPDELSRCLALEVDASLPKAIVGNAGSWGAEGRMAALQQGWDLIQEWYWNAHPWELAPDAANYPRFVNVCFGIYSEGDPGGEGYVPQSKTVGDYRAVWAGAFSCWKAEAMTTQDWDEYAK